MHYNPREIEKKWKDYWTEHKIYQTNNDSDRPKYYVLDMFPYPSGSGLHVGHPLGYIASDIFARSKLLRAYMDLTPSKPVSTTPIPPPPISPATASNWTSSAFASTWNAR